MWSSIKDAVNSTFNNMFQWAENQTLAHNSEIPAVKLYTKAVDAASNVNISEAVGNATTHPVLEGASSVNETGSAISSIFETVGQAFGSASDALSSVFKTGTTESPVFSTVEQTMGNYPKINIQGASFSTENITNTFAESVSSYTDYFWQTAQENPVVATVAVVGIATLGLVAYKAYQRKGATINKAFEEKVSELDNAVQKKLSELDEKLNELGDFLGEKLTGMIKNIKVSDILDDTIQSILQSSNIDIANISLDKLIMNYIDNLAKWNRGGKVKIEDYQNDTQMFMAGLRATMKHMLKYGLIEELTTSTAEPSIEVRQGVLSNSAKPSSDVGSSSAKPASNDVTSSKRISNYVPSFRAMKNILPCWNKKSMEANTSALIKPSI